MKKAFMYGIVSFVAVMAILVVQGCNFDEKPVPSESIGDPELQAEVSVTKNNTDSAFVVTQIRAVSQTNSRYVELVGDDRLLASIDTPVLELLEENNQGLFSAAVNVGDHLAVLKKREIRVNQPEYFVTFDAINNNTVFYVNMLRDVGTSILETQIVLPQVIQINTPQPGESISRSDDILISWNNVSNDTMELLIEGDCGPTDQVNMRIDIGTDTGQYVLMSNEFSAEIYAPTLSTCNLSLIVRRIKNGQVSSDYGMGGTAKGIQQKTINILSTP